MGIHLLGGGWADDESGWTGLFVDEARTRAAGPPVIVVVLWAEDPEEAAGYHEEYRDDFAKLAAGEVRIVQLGPDRALVAHDLAGADGILVGGGLTPGYHAAVMPAAEGIRALVAAGVPYAGFSAGAMIAGEQALLGGWLLGGVAVVAEKAGEGLDEVTLAPGLGLVDFVVDVHCAQNGTLTRAVALVDAQISDRVAAVDENTSLVIDEDLARAAGQGRVWWVERDGGRVVVTVAADQRST